MSVIDIIRKRDFVAASEYIKERTGNVNIILSFAISGNDHEMIQWAYRNGAKPHPYSLVFLQGDCNHTLFLLTQNGVNVNKTEKQLPHGALYHHMANGNTEAVCALSAFVDCSVLFDDKTFPIHKAASTGNLEMVKALCENSNGDPDLKDRMGRNALHYAAQAVSMDVYEYLVKKNCDTHLVDILGQTPDSILLDEVCKMSEKLKS